MTSVVTIFQGRSLVPEPQKWTAGLLGSSVIFTQKVEISAEQGEPRRRPNHFLFSSNLFTWFTKKGVQSNTWMMEFLCLLSFSFSLRRGTTNVNNYLFKLGDGLPKGIEGGGEEGKGREEMNK